jgi:molecular chaperone HtpG
MPSDWSLMTMSVETQKETLGFQTEVKQLLHLMIPTRKFSFAN